MNEDIQAIATQYAALRPLLDKLAGLRASGEGLPYESFREPVAILENDLKGSNTLLNLDASYARAWCQHIAYSMRLRMLSLEPGILRELASGRPLTAQVLIRAHLEAAAVAALCVRSLQDVRKSSDWAVINALIPKTLFGTGLYTKAKKNERVAEMLNFSEQRAITICTAIEALDDFTYGEHATGELEVAYGLLCEASHPNNRGTRGFATSQVVDPHGEHGWTIKYESREEITAEFVERLLELTILSMRQGYCATEMLRCMHFEDGDSALKCQGVHEYDLERIWTSLLQRPIERNF